MSITSLRPVESYSLVMRWNSTEYASSPWWEECTLDEECEYLSGGGVVDVAELGLVYWATGERCERGINQYIMATRRRRTPNSDPSHPSYKPHTYQGQPPPGARGSLKIFSTSSCKPSSDQVAVFCKLGHIFFLGTSLNPYAGGGLLPRTK